IQPIRATQLLYLLVHKPIQATRVTQIPVLPLTKPKPIPLPGVVVPEVPVSEVWDYKTVINEAIGSREQRAMLRASPRQRLSFDVVVGNDEERRAVFQMLFAYQKIVFPFPWYHLSTTLNAAVSADDTKLYFDPARTDIR